MLGKVHDHILAEVNQGAQMDAILVVTTILFDLISLGINWAVASAVHSESAASSARWIFPILVVATVAINAFAIRALLGGRGNRASLLGGLVQMYRDQQVDKYYDVALIESYGSRYESFAAVLTVLGLLAIAVPAAQFFLG